MPSIKSMRHQYHKQLVEHVLRYRPKTKIPNIADTHSSSSVTFSTLMAKNLHIELREQESNLSAQTIGQKFAEITAHFLEKTFSRLNHLRPGSWSVSTSQAGIGIAAYEQYAHLYDIQNIFRENPKLKTAFGGDYLITPDIIIARSAESDETINLSEKLVSKKDETVTLAPIRAQNIGESKGILHASISCKWTIRSDRAQNTRTEALNLIRNRKGNTPHIVAVTLEPLPGRLASLALGTGDLDCLYHSALYELVSAIEESKNQDQLELITEMIQGRRLRDISDLPFDLAV